MHQILRIEFEYFKNDPVIRPITAGYQHAPTMAVQCLSCIPIVHSIQLDYNIASRIHYSSPPKVQVCIFILKGIPLGQLQLLTSLSCWEMNQEKWWPSDRKNWLRPMDLPRRVIHKQLTPFWMPRPLNGQLSSLTFSTVSIIRSNRQKGSTMMR